jgi:hypothetical protein
MKQCPACARTYPDDSLTYCLDDGSVLFTPNDPQATQRLPLPRVTSQSSTEVFPSTQPVRQESNRWPIYILVALLCVAIGGAILALLSFGYKKFLDTSASSTAQTSSDLNQRNASGSNGNKQDKNGNTTASNINGDDKGSSSADNKSPSWQLVGAWRANVTEQGGKYELTVTFNPDGTYKFVSKDAQRNSATDNGTWQYSDGILHQTFSNGASGKGSVQWVDNNTFELTIIDNGVPVYSGIKRRYRRIK